VATSDCIPVVIPAIAVAHDGTESPLPPLHAIAPMCLDCQLGLLTNGNDYTTNAPRDIVP
jgi:hypothetical protein